MIRFYSNGGSDVGYKAKASFISLEQSKSSELKVRVGCGGLVESVGGAITMMKMISPNVNETESEALFDCIWLVRPNQGYMLQKTHISLKVETFVNMAAKSEITIIQGITSDRPVLETIESSSLKSASSRNLVVPITSGFYVRLRGKFNSESRLAIVYTAFSYASKLIIVDLLVLRNAIRSSNILSRLNWNIHLLNDVIFSVIDEIFGT